MANLPETAVYMELDHAVHAAMSHALLDDGDSYRSFHPTTLDLAIMCQYSYNEKDGNVALPDGFEKIFECKNTVDGYKGAAFFNNAKKQLVIGHGGTVDGSDEDYYANVLGVGLQEITSQNKSAYVFSAFVIKEYQGKAMSISLTGHSLGGWLAQTTALFLKDITKKSKVSVVNPQVNLMIYNVKTKRQCQASLQEVTESVHVHIVSFDSPGCRKFLTRIYEANERSQAEAEVIIRKLDIEVYVSKPNFFNSFGRHTGRLFSLFDLEFIRQNAEPKKIKKTWTRWGGEKFLEWKFNVPKCISGVFKNIDDDELKKHFEFTVRVHSIATIIDTIKTLNENNESVKEIKDWGDTIYSSVDFTKGRNIGRFKICEFNPETLPVSIFDDEEYQFLLSISLLYKIKLSRNIFNEHNKIFESIDDKALKFEIPLECYERTKIAFNIRILNGSLSHENFVTYWKCWMLRNRKHVLKFQNASSYVALYGKPAEYMILHEMVQSDALVTRSEFVGKLTNFVNNLRTNRDNLILTYDLGGNSYHASAQVYATVKRLMKDENIATDVLCVNYDILKEMAKSNIKIFCEKNKFLTLYIVEHENIDEVVKKISDFMHPSSTKIIFVRAQGDSEIADVNGRIEFKNLTVDGQSKLLKAKVNFQGSEVTLEELVQREIESNTEMFRASVDNAEILKKLLTNDVPEIIIGQQVSKATSSLDAVLKYYIKRQFSKNVLKVINQEIEETMPNHYPGCYIITGKISPEEVAEKLKINRNLVTWTNTFSSNFDAPEGKSVFLSSQSDGDLVQGIQSQTNDFHWFEYVEDKVFVWQASSCFKCRKLPEVEPSVEHFKEETTMNSSNRVIILGDEAGNGKTTMMFKFAREAKDRAPQSWIIVTSLASISDQIVSHFNAGVDLANIAEFFTSFDSPYPESSALRSLRVSIFETLLQRDGGLFFFFDGFDEIPPKLRHIVVLIAQAIVYGTKAKLTISSRFYSEDKLESALGTFAVRMNPLTIYQQIEFLCEFWKAQPEFIEKNVEPEFDEKAKVYAKQIFQHIQKTTIGSMSKVLEIPLMLFMAGIVSFQSFFEHFTYGFSGSVTIFVSAIDLYKKFIKSMTDRALEKKFVQSTLSTWHHKAAFYFLSPSFILDEHYKKAFEMITYVDEEMLTSLSRIGLLQAREMNFQFLHRSIAEYFTAEFLISNLDRENEKKRNRTLDFLKLNFFIPSFYKIRYFMDHLMAEHMSEAENESLSINGCKDLLDRTPLFYSVALECFTSNLDYNDGKLRLVPEDFDKWKNIFEEDSQNIDGLGQSPLCYWSFRYCYNLFEYICYESQRAKKDLKRDSIWKMIFVASLRGDFDFVEIALNEVSIENIENVFKAIKFASYLKTEEHKECIKYIIQNSKKFLYDFRTYKYLIHEEYRSCSDNFLEWTPVDLDMFMWLCCKDYFECTQLSNLLTKKYCTRTSNDCERDTRHQINISEWLQPAHDFLKRDCKTFAFIPDAISHQEFELLRLIQCALIITDSVKTKQESFDHFEALLLAFTIRMIKLRSKQETEVHNLKLNGKLVPSFDSKIYLADTLNSEYPLQVIPFTFTIPVENGRKKIKGKLICRYESIALDALPKEEIAVYTCNDSSWKPDDNVLGKSEIHSNPSIWDKFSGANFWKWQENDSTVMMFRIDELELVAETNDKCNHFEECLGEFFLDTAQHFAVRKSSVQTEPPADWLSKAVVTRLSQKEQNLGERRASIALLKQRKFGTYYIGRDTFIGEIEQAHEVVNESITTKELERWNASRIFPNYQI